MTASSTRPAVHLRRLLVSMHVLVTGGWLATAVGMAALSFLALRTADPALTHAALWMAHVLDDDVLVPFALTTAYTGVMLGVLTPWGFVRHRWVVTKLLITVGGLYLGVAWLGRWLEEAVAASAAGGLGPVGIYLVWGALLIGALMLATWLGVAKPGGPTRWGRNRTRRPPAPGTPTYLLVLVAPVLDWAAGVYGGLMATVALACLAQRRWRSRTPQQPAATRNR